MLPFTSLNAATTTGAGASKDLEEVLATHLAIVEITGNPSSVTIVLEGSHDGSRWVYLGQVANFNGVTAIAGAGAVRHIRANLTTLTGGTSPTVTATIASA